MIEPHFKNELVTLYNNDCLKIMKEFKKHSIDAVICDLPFGVTSCDFDNIIPFEEMWNCLHFVCKGNAPIILFGVQPFATDLIASNREEFKYELIWKKNVPTGMSSAKYRPMKYHETILVFHTNTSSTYNPIMKARIGVGKACYNYNHYCGKNNHLDLDKVKKKYDPDFVQPSSVLEFNVVPNRKGKLYPTEKPVELLEYLVKTYTNEGETVLDFACGSVSLLKAASNCNRKTIGIEKEERFAKVSKERFR